mmetsp:Transcript_46564/g.104665  ORF Transcript_46564/g.104665 Transcript_46564/m.104665 type:complete len:99 (-) Transcript_46564:108-404(-)
MAGRRSILPALVALLALAAVANFSLGFVAPPGEARTSQGVPTSSAVAGAAAGLLIAQPAHANIFYEEILPYSVTISFAIIWGIILGFVLLRLQEAFPE